MQTHRATQGDCILSIGKEYGFFWQTLWNHPENAALKTERKDPNVLKPDDEVFIPEKELKEENCATEKRHKFLLKGAPAKLRLQLMRFNKPRANKPYIIDIDGALVSGTTDAEGRIEIGIPSGARQGKLILKDGKEVYPLNLGHLDPVSEISGVQARLNNLGYECGEVDNVLGALTVAALKLFQEEQRLPVTGEPDAATCDKLREVHGS